MHNFNGIPLRNSGIYGSNSTVAKVASKFATLAAITTILVGSSVLLGWQFNIGIFKGGLGDSEITIKINTALCFIFCGLSLLLLPKEQDTQDKPSLGGGSPSIRNWRIRAKSQEFKFSSSKESSKPKGLFVNFSPSIICTFCGFLVFLLGLLTFSEYLFGGFLGIDELIYPDKILILREPIHQPVRMGLNQSLNFILIGLSLQILSEGRTRRSYYYAQGFVLVAALIALLALVGSVYRVGNINNILTNTAAMPLGASLTFLVLCFGILWNNPSQGFMETITSETYSGWLARRLLLAAISIPFCLGWLIAIGEKLGQYDAAFAIALFAIALIVIFVGLIWSSASEIQYLSKQCYRVQAELKENEEKLRAFVDGNIIGIVFSGLEGQIFQANDEFLRIIGYSREDLLAGKINWIEITPPEFLYLDEKGIQEAKLKGACTPYEKEYLSKDGSRVCVLIGYVLLGQERKEAVSFILDLSERKQAEVALSQSEAKFRLAANNIPNFFAIYDAQRRFQFINAAGLQLARKSQEEVIGLTDEEVFPDEMTQAYLKLLVTARETGQLQTGEATINFPNNGMRTTLLKYVPLFGENGEISQILGFGEDITARKKAESAQQNQQKWLQDVLDLMPTPLLFIEPGTARVTFANKAADDLAGGEFPKAKSGVEYHKYYYCTDAMGIRIPDEEMPGVRVARGESLNGFEMDWHTPLGVRSLLVDADTLPAMHGYSATCILIFQDITKQKQIEKALTVGNQRLELLFDATSKLLSSEQPIALLDSLFSKLSEQIRLDCQYLRQI